MKKSTKMVEEITQKRKMTPIVIENLHKRIFYNCLLAIGVMLYLCLIDVVYLYAKQEIVIIAFKIFAMIGIFAAVFTWEWAYRKDNGKIAIVGIEFLIISSLILYFPQIYANLDKKFCAELTFLPIFCSIYYVAKSITIYTKTQKAYQNNLSDVKEIIKEET